MRICTLNVQLSRTEYVCLIFGMISLIYFLIPKGEGYFGSDVAKLCTAGRTFDCFYRNSKGLFASISTMNLMFDGSLGIADDDDEEMYRKSNLLSVVCKELACIGFITIFLGWFIVRQISESRIREPHEFGYIAGNHHKAYFWYTVLHTFSKRSETISAKFQVGSVRGGQEKMGAGSCREARWRRQHQSRQQTRGKSETYSALKAEILRLVDRSV